MISLLWSTLLWAQEFPKKLLQARDQSMGLEIPERINMISQSLRGIPYLFNPEGEETGVDSDPMWNFAHMDCLTYVEAVLAFSISDNVIEALEVRNDLRYLQDEIHYQNRKHFMFTQWIPHNLELGYIQEITGEIGNTRNIVRSYDAKIWNNWRSRKKIFLEEDNYPIGDFSLEVLSPQEALDQIEHIPSGSILIVVRDSGWGNPIMVSHIGFVIRNKKNQIKFET